MVSVVAEMRTENLLIKILNGITTVAPKARLF
jgi:hypothetical protein